MSLLLKEIKKICSEEQMNFSEFLDKIKKKDRPKPISKGELFGESEL